MLFILTIVSAFNYVDRLTLGLLAQNIKLELALSDTQLGILTGISFAIFYSLLGVPMARWADRGNRVRIVALTTLLWGVGVAACGVARNFQDLLLLRVLVAVGEAGCVPVAHSLIAEYFARSERPRATSFYMLGSPISVVIGYLIAGQWNAAYGWRSTFFLIASPCFVLAAVAWWTLREPRLAVRSTVGSSASVDPELPGLLPIVRILWSIGSYRQILVGFSILSFFTYGISNWFPAYFIRSFRMDSAVIGIWFSVIFGIGGLVGTLGGGFLATRYAGGRERRQLIGMALAYSFFTATMIGVFLARTQATAFIFLAISTTGGALASAPLFATVQTIVPARCRATAIAILYLAANLIGLGLGPVATGIISDALKGYVGNESLRYALLCLSPGSLWAAAHLWRASQLVNADLERVRVPQFEGGVILHGS